jgi:hypothetical protein
VDAAAADTAEPDAALANTELPTIALLAATLGSAAADTADELAALCVKLADAAMLGRTALRVPALAARRRGALGARGSGVLGMGGALRVQGSSRRYPHA